MLFYASNVSTKSLCSEKVPLQMPEPRLKWFSPELQGHKSSGLLSALTELQHFPLVHYSSLLRVAHPAIEFTVFKRRLHPVFKCSVSRNFSDQLQFPSWNYFSAKTSMIRLGLYWRSQRRALQNQSRVPCITHHLVRSKDK